jgi:hypothetical protein
LIVISDHIIFTSNAFRLRHVGYRNHIFRSDHCYSESGLECWFVETWKYFSCICRL